MHWLVLLAVLDGLPVTVVSGTLERIDCSTAEWEVVCKAPCVTTVSRDIAYRFDGRKITFPKNAFEVTLGTREDAHYAGLIVGAVGLVALLAGVVVVSWSLGEPTLDTSALVAGSVLGGVGALASVTGFVVHYATIRF